MNIVHVWQSTQGIFEPLWKLEVYVMSAFLLQVEFTLYIIHLNLSFIVCCSLIEAQAYMVSDKFDCFMSSHVERNIVSGHLELENN